MIVEPNIEERGALQISSGTVPDFVLERFQIFVLERFQIFVWERFQIFVLERFQIRYRVIPDFPNYAFQNFVEWNANIGESAIEILETCSSKTWKVGFLTSISFRKRKKPEIGNVRT